jgi:Fe-S cluster assembly protein SufB
MATTVEKQAPIAGVTAYKYGFRDDVRPVYRARPGLSREVVEEMSSIKGEPQWMREFRLQALDIFLQKPMMHWGADLSGLNFEEIYYYVRPTDRVGRSWDEVPEELKRTFDRLGIPEEELEKKGVIFLSMDEGLKQYPELVRQYFGTVVPPTDNKFAALNSAVWSGGSFIYVPPGVKVDFPLQAYFRINAERMGQFERTLIIVDEGAQVHYVEGCTAPIYTSESLHSAVVEIVVKKGARCRYTTIQNWAPNVYNLVTKRAVAYEDALMEWIDGNIGSKVTMKYPSVYLLGKGARAEILSIAFAARGQHQDAGGKVIHAAPYTSSRILSKSISKDGGRTSYRGLLKIERGAYKSKANVVCDALILDPESRSDTYPYIEIEEDNVTIGHEASVSKIGEEQLFYLMSRGLTEHEAATLIVSGFIEPLVRELPMEYAVEMNRLIELQMEGSVG